MRTRPGHVHFIDANVTSQRSSTPLTMSSVTWSPASHESLIGPPSELIHIDDFLRSARDSAEHVFVAPDPLQQAERVEPMPQDPVVSECRWVSHTNDWTIR